MLTESQSMRNAHFGRISVAKDHIKLLEGSIEPVHSAPYGAGPKFREFEKFEIEKMLKDNKIEPAQTEWAALIVFAPKEDGCLGLCVNCRRLNAVTERNTYLIPRRDECLDLLDNAGIFSVLDTNSRFCQVGMYKTDCNTTALPSHYASFQFICIPFGLRDGPGYFQKTMDVFFSTVRWKNVLAYLDHNVTFSKSQLKRIGRVRKSLTLLCNAGVTLKLKNCKTFTETIDYLEHLNRAKGIECSLHTKRATRGLKAPTNSTKLQFV